MLDSYLSYVNHMSDNIDIICDGYLDSNIKNVIVMENET